MIILKTRSLKDNRIRLTINSIHKDPLFNYKSSLTMNYSRIYCTKTYENFSEFIETKNIVPVDLMIYNQRFMCVYAYIILCCTQCIIV